jgi:hypothetical protein
VSRDRFHQRDWQVLCDLHNSRADLFCRGNLLDDRKQLVHVLLSLIASK